MKKGDQIKYDPGHCEAEYGFVTEVRGDTIFCRFWNNVRIAHLRTMANSEGCNKRDIKPYNSNIPQAVIDAWLIYLGYEGGDIDESEE